MSFLTVKNVSIKGVVSCVPPYIEENISLPFYKVGEAEEVISSTGIERRHIVKNGITASDLCYEAGMELLEQLGWEKESVDGICYVTQSPDYINHPTGFVLLKSTIIPLSPFTPADIAYGSTTSFPLGYSELYAVYV